MLMMSSPDKKRPAPTGERGVITVYGHRLSSLSRPAIRPQDSYHPVNIIVSKILKSADLLGRDAQSFLASGRSISEAMMRAMS